MPPVPLRRSFSSPSVRATPYSSALANLSAGSGRAHAHGNRRSLGSQTTRRRVLADLEWWRIVDGQHDDQTAQQDAEEGDQEQTRDRRAEAPASAVTPSVWVSDSDLELSAPTQEFTALSITPVTPPRLGRRHTSMFESSPPSSLESTPETDEGVRFSLLDLDSGFCELPRFSLALPQPPLPLMRARTFDFSALLNESADRFADIGVPSRLPDIFN
ncbi:hypothetical protein HWV62_8381 [Athelia sp. TMB]|nr:hypothetical protein HWV62_8381 [Athelia sp. TMB]